MRSSQLAAVSRGVIKAAFVVGLEKSRVEFVATDMPNANRLTVRLMAVIAQEEREMIAARTKAALAAAKARGKRLGGWGGPKPNPQTGAEGVRRKANAFAERFGPTVRCLQQRGLSLHAIAAELTAKGIMTARGGSWTATAVRNLLARIDA